MNDKSMVMGLALCLLLGMSCGDSAAGQDDAAQPDGATYTDAAGQQDGSVPNDSGVGPTLHCRLVHITPHAEAAAELVRIRVQMSDNQGSDVVLTELDEVVGGTVRRTLPMVPTSPPGGWPDRVFGFDGIAESEDTALCYDLPGFEPRYFEMRGTVDGQPATGTCGFGPGSGGWPPVVRVSCGEQPVADSAIMNVYVDPFAPPPGATEIMIMLWLNGPATGVVLTPDLLIGDKAGQLNTHTIGTGQTFEPFDIRADDPSSGPVFDGTVGAGGRAVFFSIWANITLGPDFCLDGDDPFNGAPKLHVQGSGTSDQTNFTWTTSGFSCLTLSLDQDHALP